MMFFVRAWVRKAPMIRYSIRYAELEPLYERALTMAFPARRYVTPNLKSKNIHWHVSGLNSRDGHLLLEPLEKSRGTVLRPALAAEVRVYPRGQWAQSLLDRNQSALLAR
jgi:hypothetical protein